MTLFEKFKKRTVQDAIDTVQVEVKKKVAPHVTDILALAGMAFVFYLTMKSSSRGAVDIPQTINVTYNYYNTPGPKK